MLLKVAVAVLVGLLAWWLIPGEDPFDPAKISGKRVLVTGGSSGVGEELAYHYARLGASVVITARRQDLLQKVVQKCKELGRPDAKFSYVAADMANMAETSRVIEAAVNVLGGLDHLVLNHAWFSGVDYWRGSQENLTMLHQRFDVNFFSYAHLVSHALPHLENSDHGAIGVVSSGVGKFPSGLAISYSASKFALDGFFSGLGQELQMAGSNTTTTLCVLGNIANEEGNKWLHDFLEKRDLDTEKANRYLTFGSSNEAAYNILRATALGEKEMYYPSAVVKPLVMLRHIFPGLMEMTNAFFKKSPS